MQCISVTSDLAAGAWHALGRSFQLARESGSVLRGLLALPFSEPGKDPADERRYRPDLVVMGTPERAGLSRLLKGNVAVSAILVCPAEVQPFLRSGAWSVN